MLKDKDMTTDNENMTQYSGLPNFYCVVKDQEQDFYWAINLEDHPNSFLLDPTYQNLNSPKLKRDQESMVVIQPWHF